MAYKRLKTVENSKTIILKVVSVDCERWSFTRVTAIRLWLGKCWWLGWVVAYIMGGSRLREVVAHGTWRLDCDAKSDVQTENSRACLISRSLYAYEATSINLVHTVPLTKLPFLVYHSTNTCPVFLVWEEQGLSNLDDSWQPVYRLHQVPQLHPAGSKVDWQLCLLPLCCHAHGEVQVNQTHQRTEYKAWHSGLCI